MSEFISQYPVTFYLMVANVLFSLAGLLLYPQLIKFFYLKPYRTVRNKSWYELVTSGFLHANIGHLFVNMFTLYFFGQVMEHKLGGRYFLGLYLTGLIISALPSVYKFKDNPNYATLGASGAVGAVLFAFIAFYPMQSIYLLFIPIPIPACIFGVLYLVYSMYASKQERGRINHEAHAAGAIWGILYLLIFVPNTIDHWLTIFSRF